MSAARALLVAVALAVVAALARQFTAQPESTPAGSPIPQREERFSGRDTLLEAARDRRSDLLVEVDAPVAGLLADDREGSPHQRFVLQVGQNLTVLVAHNLELADRVPLERGDRVTVRGEYEWNAKGGVLHWTHDDPAGQHPAGFVRHEGRLYQ